MKTADVKTTMETTPTSLLVKSVESVAACNSTGVRLGIIIAGRGGAAEDGRADIEGRGRGGETYGDFGRRLAQVPGL
jgi:hypothetical protein